MGHVKKIIDRFLKIQNSFYPEVKEYATQVKQRVSMLRVVGLDGESILLKFNNGRLHYASENEIPVHVFRTTVDTFLDILAGDQELREAITKDKFVIEDASTGSIDLVECEKWAKAFNNLKGMIRKYLGA